MPIGQMEECGEGGISVMDVYDIVTDFAKEFRPIIDMYGADPLNNIMSKVVTMLEHLEDQTVKIEELRKMLHDRDAIIAKLEKDKVEKAAERQRFEKELEQIEEHWRDESHEMVAVVNRLQEENKKLLKNLADKQDSSPTTHPLSPELDIGMLQKSRASIEKLRDQLKLKDREISAKANEIDNLLDQVDSLTILNKDIRKKLRTSQTQTRSLIEERADLLTQIQELHYELNVLHQRIAIAEKEKEDLVQSSLEPAKVMIQSIDLSTSGMSDSMFVSDEYKELQKENNELKCRINELEKELGKYKCEEPPVVDESDDTISNQSEGEEEEDNDDDDDAPVQGPLPYEPHDAPWKKLEQSKKSESAIRKIFRKIFNETNMPVMKGNITFLSSSPKKNPAPQKSLEKELN